MCSLKDHQNSKFQVQENNLIHIFWLKVITYRLSLTNSFKRFISASLLSLSISFHEVFRFKMWSNFKYWLTSPSVVIMAAKAATSMSKKSNLKFVSNKVHIFWEGHKILRNLHLTFLSYEVPVKSKVEILQNFVAFSEYMNFNVDTRLVYFWP